MPFGAWNSKLSPSLLPISARANGEDTEIRLLLDVGFEVADDLVAHFLARILVGKIDRRTEHDARARVQPADVDDFGIRERRFELVDAALGETLLLARRVILGVLLQIAVRTRLGDRLDDARAFDALQPFQFSCAGAPRPSASSVLASCQFPVEFLQAVDFVAVAEIERMQERLGAADGRRVGDALLQGFAADRERIGDRLLAFGRVDDELRSRRS